jgi:FMN phosphatase YigB (HAD superfamily)
MKAFDMRGIIFDFNRTIFDPESGALFDGARELLSALHHEGVAMILIAKTGEDRQKLLQELQIDIYFTEVRFLIQKRLEDFRKIVDYYRLNPSKTFVIGDRINLEISLGIQLGLQTIWFRNGRFAHEEPDVQNGRPSHTAYNWAEIQSILEFHYDMSFNNV